MRMADWRVRHGCKCYPCELVQLGRLVNGLGEGAGESPWGVENAGDPVQGGGGGEPGEALTQQPQQQDVAAVAPQLALTAHNTNSVYWKKWGTVPYILPVLFGLYNFPMAKKT